MSPCHASFVPSVHYIQLLFGWHNIESVSESVSPTDRVKCGGVIAVGKLRLFYPNPLSIISPGLLFLAALVCPMKAGKKEKRQTAIYFPFLRIIIIFVNGL